MSMKELRCADLDARSVRERYVAGTTTPAETRDFELHLLTCRDCQEAVRLGAATRAQLKGTPASKRMLRWPTIAALSLAASVVLVVGISLPGKRRLANLGRVTSLPAYAGVPVRSAPADSIFDRAMAFYKAGRYPDAQAALRDARRLGAEAVPTGFFLGAIALHGGDALSAANEFTLVIDRGPSPYTAEAHYYLAKAWLLRGAADSALIHLSIAATSPAPVSLAAKELRDSVSEVIRER